ncbi:hypothetical protein [Burkholderia thailandensis]|uniref:hypothetical protein n=1 Tax=Burkholderia thailandensis TaxID=57975 RepID=UPI0004B62454|nr:hypothetical protein [Burkholderia thailandensis]
MSATPISSAAREPERFTVTPRTGENGKTGKPDALAWRGARQESKQSARTLRTCLQKLR